MDDGVSMNGRAALMADLELRAITIGDALGEAARLWPDAEALVEILPDGSTARRWTFAQLHDDGMRLAGALLTRYAPGERIAVWAPNCPEWILLDFAAARAGLVLVTVNPAFQARELAFVLRQSGASGLFLAREHRGNPMAQIAKQVASGLPQMRELVDLDDGIALFAARGAPPPLPRVQPDDAAQIQYTSGTTGFPKGVLLRHMALLNNARHFFVLTGVPAHSTQVLMLPLFHTSGCVLHLLGALQTGCRLLVPRQFDPALALMLTAREGGSALLGVPTMLQALIEAHTADPRPLPDLRTLASGGSMVAPELARAAQARFGCPVAIVYGQTEVSALATLARPDVPGGKDYDTVGQAMPHTEVAILDIESGEPLPAGMQGEIGVRGYGVMIGYHDDPDATAATIDAQGWLHSGDLGTMDEAGRVRLTGRVRDMIIRGGENLFPAEIEAVLLEHEDVAEVAVVGVPDAYWGEVVAAFVRMVPGRSLDPAALAAHCRAQIAPQKTPVHWIEVTQWPLTGSGKIQKYVLRDRWIAQQQPAEKDSPST